MKIKLSALWVAAMFSWVYGDLLRIYSGDYIPGEPIGDMQPTQELWLLSAIIMIIPGAMVFLSVTLKQKVNRRLNIIFGIFFVGFDIIFLIMLFPMGSPPYEFVTGMVLPVFTGLIVWYAWKWPKHIENVK